jgi:branched-chain amino acid transport system substrate-binding protein
MPERLTRRDLLIAGAGLAAASAVPRFAFAQGPGTFRIGSLCPVTGAGSPYGSGMQKAIEIAVAEVNAAGGAGGSKLELFAEDGQTKPDAAVLAAKKLIEVNKVQAILGTWSSGVTLAVMPLTDAANIIEMNCSGAPAISTLDTKDLVYYLSVTAFALFLSLRSLESKRWRG